MNGRAAGVLLHVSSLPSQYGIGSFGAARRWIDFLAAAGQKYWQVLPLAMTGYGDSPYQSVSGRSGNPYFIDPEGLVRDGLATGAELAGLRVRGRNVDYGAVYRARYPFLRAAFGRLKGDRAFRAFAERGEYRDFALFMAIKQISGGAPFWKWEFAYKYRVPGALERFGREHADEVLFWQFLAWRFGREWREVRRYAHGRGVKIVGDLPLYPAADSEDVWAHPRAFDLDENLLPRGVAGVPPDYFSPTGQLWGNPLYRWDVAEEDGFALWKARIARARELFDVVRIDHFRGLDRYWAVPAGDADASGGRWLTAPGDAMLGALRAEFGRLPLIAEDLGILDDGVRGLLRRAGIPGMKVLQFAFDGNPENEYLPERIGAKSVVYTGTHDNDTLRGYLASLGPKKYSVYVRAASDSAAALGVPASFADKRETLRSTVRLAYACKARLAVVPAQDLLELSSSARMNTPASAQGNWAFRMADFRIEERAAEFAALARESGRV